MKTQAIWIRPTLKAPFESIKILSPKIRLPLETLRSGCQQRPCGGKAQFIPWCCQVKSHKLFQARANVLLTKALWVIIYCFSFLHSITH